MLLIKNALIENETTDILINDNKIIKINKNINEKCANIIDAKGLTLLPAFVDMHTHLREPGFEGKEDILSGSMAAINGGFSSICCMPNTSPIVDNQYIVKYICDRAKEVGLAKIYPIGAVSKCLLGESLAEIGKMKDAGIVAISDDGNPVYNSFLMRLAMEYASDFNLIVLSHCEDKLLVNGGLVNEGINSTLSGLKGISVAAEEVMVARDIVLAKTLNKSVHICHISTKGSVQLIRDAKKNGVKVTCETCPHYFSGTDELILNYDTNAKVNPPLRTEEDRLAIIEGLNDGTIDVIATDHAPHKFDDKNCEFIDASNGISGLETAYALSYTNLVKTKIISQKRLVQLMTTTPSKILNLSFGEVKVGGLADLVLVDNETKYNIDTEKFLSKGKNTPFNGKEVYGNVVYTLVEGRVLKDKGEVK